MREIADPNSPDLLVQSRDKFKVSQQLNVVLLHFQPCRPFTTVDFLYTPTEEPLALFNVDAFMPDLGHAMI